MTEGKHMVWCRQTTTCLLVCLQMFKVSWSLIVYIRRWTTWDLLQSEAKTSAPRGWREGHESHPQSGVMLWKRGEGGCSRRLCSDRISITAPVLSYARCATFRRKLMSLIYFDGPSEQRCPLQAKAGQNLQSTHQVFGLMTNMNWPRIWNIRLFGIYLEYILCRKEKTLSGRGSGDWTRLYLKWWFRGRFYLLQSHLRSPVNHF